MVIVWWITLVKKKQPFFLSQEKKIFKTNRKNSQLQKVHFDSTNNFSTSELFFCLALLIQDLLGEGYDLVLTSRFQSDPLERWFGKYRQISGGRFLVGLQDINSSEIIIKVKSLHKEDLYIDNVKDI